MNAEPLSVRAGVATGVVIAGVVPGKRLAYDVWGKCVDLAARLEGNSKPGHVLVSDATFEESDYCLAFHPAQSIDLDNGTQITAHMLIDTKSAYHGGGKPVKKQARINAGKKDRPQGKAQQ